MTRPASLPSATAVLALALFAASGLGACADAPAADEIPPIVLTEGDGVLRGPDEGATPVDPPSPAPAGDVRTEPEARRDEDPPPPTDDDEPDPPPPAPDDGDDADDTDVGDAEGPEVDDSPGADDDADDDADDADDDADDDVDNEDGDEDGDD